MISSSELFRQPRLLRMIGNNTNAKNIFFIQKGFWKILLWNVQRINYKGLVQKKQPNVISYFGSLKTFVEVSKIG